MSRFYLIQLIQADDKLAALAFPRRDSLSKSSAPSPSFSARGTPPEQEKPTNAVQVAVSAAPDVFVETRHSIAAASPPQHTSERRTSPGRSLQNAIVIEDSDEESEVNPQDTESHSGWPLERQQARRKGEGYMQREMGQLLQIEEGVYGRWVAGYTLREPRPRPTPLSQPVTIRRTGTRKQKSRKGPSAAGSKKRK